MPDILQTNNMTEMREQNEILELKHQENMKTLYNKEIKLNILKDLSLDKVNIKQNKQILENSLNKLKKKDSSTITKNSIVKKEILIGNGTSNQSNIKNNNIEKTIKSNNSISENIYPSESIYSIYSLNKSGPKDNLILLSNSK